MKNEHDDHEHIETPWAIVFLREEDGAKEAMDKMVAAMEDAILHGTDDESRDCFEALKCYAAYAESFGVNLPDSINRLGSMAMKRHIKAEHEALTEALRAIKGDEVADAVTNLIKALSNDGDDKAEGLSDEDAGAAIAAIEAMFGPPKEADSAD